MEHKLLPYLGSIEEHLQAHAVNPDRGLEPQEIQRRQQQYGPNQLQEKARDPWWKKVVSQLMDIMVLILLLACLVSALTGEWLESIVILAIVVVNAILGVVQEGRAEKALEALKQMSAPKARVLRSGQQSLIDASALVPGDIVLIEAGDVVPADLRLLQSSNLKAEEASLTGESVPVEKDARFTSGEDLGIGDRDNMLFSSTAVTYGKGTGLVVGTGSNTEIGKIADQLQEIQDEHTPLQRSLNQLGKWLALLCLIVCAIVFVEEVWVDPSKENILEAFKTAVALAVAAIPEGLAAIVTIVLAIGMKRMADKHSIVKRLLAVETLGCVDVICSDKTGTLTQNAMTVTTVYAGGEEFQISGTGYEPRGQFLQNQTEVAPTAALHRMLQIAMLCNDATLQQHEGNWSILGDPTEGALLTLGGKAGLSREEVVLHHRIVGDLPFDSDRKRMTVFCEGFEEGPVVGLTKGAPDVILARCSHELLADGTIQPMSDTRRAELNGVNSSYANKALRVLAFGYRAQPVSSDAETVESQLVFAGLTGMIDPARPEAQEAIAVCKTAGIRPVMITGDHRDTASAIAVDLGLMQPGDRALTGAELDQMNEEQLRRAVQDTSVYARVSPEHKVRIVSALRAEGHIASMTGDGVNDAPALKQADIGVAMGITGTEVAKGAADMILTDDNFATIVDAVEEGRIIYSNIRKFVGFLLSCNVAEILVIFITTMIMGLPPLDAIQLLWLNLVTDSFPALALGREKGDPDIMSHKPRSKDEAIINREMLGAVLVQALTIFAAVFCAFYIGQAGWLGDHSHNLLTEGRTLAFTTLIFSELLRAYSCRSERFSVLRIGLFSNKTMLGATVLSLALLLIVLYVPVLNTVFHTVPLDLVHWGVVLVLGLLPFLMGELYKFILHGRKHL